MVKFKIISTGWNCEKYIEDLCNSIKEQTYQNFTVTFVDDGSKDYTTALLTKYARREWYVIKTLNQGAYYARQTAVYSGSTEYDVIVMLDMDDKLLPNALELIAKEYENPATQMTYGNWINNNGAICGIDTLHYSDEVHAAKSYRHDQFRITHLRTFRKSLWDRVGIWELFENEENVLGDCEMLYRMVEMAGKEGIAVIETPIYVYNMVNPDRATERWILKDEALYQKQLETIKNRPIWQG